MLVTLWNTWKYNIFREYEVVLFTNTWNTFVPVHIWTAICTASIFAETALSCARYMLLHIKYCYGYVYRGKLTTQKLFNEIWILRCKITSCIIPRSDWIHEYLEKLGKLMTLQPSQSPLQMNACHFLSLCFLNQITPKKLKNNHFFLKNRPQQMLLLFSFDVQPVHVKG